MRQTVEQLLQPNELCARIMIMVESVHFESSEENPFFPGIMDISPEEVLQKKDTLRIIDVRQPDEYSGELGHISESELLVLGTLPETLPSLSKSTPIVFVCRSGGRSAQATAFAQSLGFQEVYNMKGGMMLWNDMRLPTKP